MGSRISRKNRQEQASSRGQNSSTCAQSDHVNPPNKTDSSCNINNNNNIDDPQKFNQSVNKIKAKSGAADDELNKDADASTRLAAPGRGTAGGDTKFSTLQRQASHIQQALAQRIRRSSSFRAPTNKIRGFFPSFLKRKVST